MNDSNNAKNKEEVHYYTYLPFIAVGKSFLLDVTKGGFYNSQDLFTYITMKMLYTGTPSMEKESKVVISPEIIVSMMKLANSSRNKKIISESIGRLLQGGMIKAYTDFSFTKEVETPNLDSVMFLTLEEKFNDDEKFFVKVYHEDYIKLLECGERNASKLFHVYCIIASDIYEKGNKKSFLINADIARVTGIDKKTLTKYIKVMEEGFVLSRTMVKVTDNVGNVNNKNIFTRYGFRKNLKLGHGEEFVD